MWWAVEGEKGSLARVEKAKCHIPLARGGPFEGQVWSRTGEGSGVPLVAQNW